LVPHDDAPATVRGGQARRMTTIHVRGLRHGNQWIVTQDDDPTPIVRAATRAEAEREARMHAQTFGHDRVIVHELDRDERLLRIPDPDPQPPYPGGALGRPAG
jgi:hypothetical protein